MRCAPRPPARLISAAAVATLVVVMVAGPARGQFNGDPFDPYRAAYRSSSLPVQTNIIPGQPRSVTPPGLGTVPGIGTPWDLTYSIPQLRPSPYGGADRLGLDIYDPINDAYRQYDEVFDRVYRPNAQADERFYDEQEERRDIYLEAMREPDPRRRAELIKQFRDYSRRTSLSQSPSASRDALDAEARLDQQGTAARGADVAGSRLPRTVRSYEDLRSWSRLVNREALRVGVVRSGQTN